MDTSINENIIDSGVVKNILKPRDPQSHKGDYGNGCLIAGSYGMMGAAVLAAKACLKSGVGKLTCYIPKTGYEIMQSSVPEAIVKVAGKKIVKHIEEMEQYNALGIGPGIGIHQSHEQLIDFIFSGCRKPIVIDADALNVMADKKELITKIPPGSILTPHPKEFERLFHRTRSDVERNMLALEMAEAYNIYLIVKCHRTVVATPDKKNWINSTGNAGMATAGSGDVLTGIITGLYAQGYSPEEASIMGVYLHGLAGDLAADKFSQQSLIAGDIIDNLGEAFKFINNK